MKIGRGAASILTNGVTIIDMEKLEIAGHLDAGQPDGMAWANR